MLGIYPLLTDHTSWFIAADFDEENWAESTRKLIGICSKHQISAYLERSRSGNGGHVWIFFDQAYPARRSRSVLLHLLGEAEVISRFDKNSGDELNFPNSEFYIRQKAGRSTFEIPRFFKAWNDSGMDLEIPRGFIGKLLRFCREKEIEFTFSDDRKKKAAIPFRQSIELRDFQTPALEASRKKDFGMIVAPPGSGKTIIALKIAEEKEQPALIIVHRKQLMEQRRDRISSFLGMPRHEIAIFGKKRKGQPKVTLATIQGLSRKMLKIVLRITSRFQVHRGFPSGLSRFAVKKPAGMKPPPIARLLRTWHRLATV